MATTTNTEVLIPSEFYSKIKYNDKENALTNTSSETFASVGISTSGTHYVYLYGFNFNLLPAGINAHGNIRISIKTTSNVPTVNVNVIATDGHSGGIETAITDAGRFGGSIPSSGLILLEGTTISLDSLRDYGPNFALKITYTVTGSRFPKGSAIKLYGAQIVTPYETNPLYVRDEFLWNQQAKLYIKNRGAWDFYVPSFDLFNHNKLILPGIIRTAN